jgi:hypothetical protein
MSLFDRLRKTPSEKTPEPAEAPLRKKLVDLVLGGLRDKNGRIHAEDAISAAATIVGERCIDAAGDFPLRDHQLAPGSRAFSTRANELICGDAADGDINRIPPDTIVGTLRRQLDPHVYPNTEFPPQKEVFAQFAARIGNPTDWGRVPLSVSKDNFPFIPPLRAGYETRARVDEILRPVLDDKRRCLRIATESLADILTMVAPAMDHKLALTLAIETINGMAKTAPMTEKAMQQAQQGTAGTTG